MAVGSDHAGFTQQAGPSFYLRTGKRLPTCLTEIASQSMRAPFIPFRKRAVECLTPNRLVLHLQPQEGISPRHGAKVPGPMARLGSVNMVLNDKTAPFGSALYAALRGSSL
jgi:glucose-6-phosphate 1-dehydrogenase